MSFPLFLISFASAAITTGFLIPYVRSYGLKYNLVDKPNNRKQHNKKIVRLGGIAIFCGFTFSLVLVWILGVFNKQDIVFFRELFILYLCFFMFFVLGLLDDLFTLSPFFRLIIQFLISTIFWFNNIRIDNIDLSWGSGFSTFIDLPALISFFITVIWITGLTNAINWIDGLDGLAAGNIAITALGTLFIGLKINPTPVFFFLSALIGACLGFLRFNYNPARIIMGDSGSYFLGSSISVLTLIACSNNLLSAFENINITKLNFAICLLLLPIIDMTYVIIKRIIRGNSPFMPDRGHIHHQMLKAGFKTPQTVELLYLFTFISCVFPILAIWK